MRRMIALVFVLTIFGANLTLAQDYDATATAFVVEVTLTANALTNAPDSTLPQPTEDPFSLTATALIRSATQTAEVMTGNTAVPVTAVPQGDTFALTATALVRQATEVAGGAEAAAEDVADTSNGQVLSLTLIAFAVLIAILGGLGVLVVVLGRGKDTPRKRR